MAKASREVGGRAQRSQVSDRPDDGAAAAAPSGEERTMRRPASWRGSLLATDEHNMAKATSTGGAALLCRPPTVYTAESWS